MLSGLASRASDTARTLEGPLFGSSNVATVALVLKILLGGGVCLGLFGRADCQRFLSVYYALMISRGAYVWGEEEYVWLEARAMGF